MDPIDARVVEAARAGDADAWAELVRSTQDLAVAVALGRSPTWEDALDAAQDAFATAWARIGDLRDAAAFVPWLAALVRSACSRRTRRRRLPTVPLEAATSLGSGEDPAHDVTRDDECRRLRRAIEALPAPQRSVIALHYVAGLGYEEIAGFLGIGTSAAKKRAFTARRHLEELLLVHTPYLRPSRTRRFSDTVLLFVAIRRGDHAAVAGLLAHDPTLIEASEDWSVDDALDAGLMYAAHATPLVRAAQTGDVALVRLLLDAGAEVDRRCGCAGSDTALWAATAAGETSVVAALLAAGADPDLAAFEGATPMHVARARDRDDLCRLLVAAGADPSRRDGPGRTPADWSDVPSGAAPWDRSAAVDTGVRALDLFAPLRRHDVQYWPPAYGLGQFVLLFELASALAPARTWFVGFAHGPYDADGPRHEVKETGVEVDMLLTPAGEAPERRRERFADTLDRLHADPAAKLVVCLEAPDHIHDVTAALPELRADGNVVATVVVAPFTGERPTIDDRVPEGYAGQVAFDPGRALRRIWPALDPRATLATGYPSRRHAQLAERARRLLADYRAWDPRLERPSPDRLADPVRAAAAQRLLAYLAQPFRVAEPFTSRPGERTPVAETLDAVETILAAT